MTNDPSTVCTYVQLDARTVAAYELDKAGRHRGVRINDLLDNIIIIAGTQQVAERPAGLLHHLVVGMVKEARPNGQGGTDLIHVRSV